MDKPLHGSFHDLELGRCMPSTSAGIGRSTMPAGLLDTYSVEEIFDLVASLQSHGFDE